jgi:hypothetical protein
MIRILKLFLDSRNYREVAGLWLIGSMLATMLGTLLGLFGIMTQWISTLFKGAASGPADFVVFLLYMGGLYGAPILGWRLHRRGRYGLALLAGCAPALTFVLGVMWTMREWSELA